MPATPGVLTVLALVHARFDSAARRLDFRLAVFAALALIIAWPLLSTAPAMNFFRDAQVLMPYEYTAVHSVRDYLQAPLWDPYYCGGVYALGTPQSRFVSPTFLLSLLFGTLRGESVTVFFMLIVGLEGTWRYSMSRGASAIGSLLAAPVFATSGLFAAAPPLGWINFFGFELVPWALVGVRRAVRGDPRGAVVAAGALAWMVGFGGTYAAPMSALLCGFEVVEALFTRLRRPRELGTVLLGAWLCAALSIGLAMVRLWPIAESLADAPRVIADAPGMTWAQAAEALTGHTARVGESVRWVHGALMVGMLALPVAAVGLARLRAIPLVVMGALSLWLATGYAYNYGLFRALRHLPVFSVLRYPERYLAFVALALAVLAALGIGRVEAWAKRRPWLHLPGLALGVLLCANAAMQIDNHYRLSAPRDLVAPPAVVDRPFHQARGTRWALGFYAPMSRGSLSCWDAYPIPQSPLLRSDLQHEEYLVDASSGTVERRAWSPNRIDLHVKLDKPARLHVNQNWHAGWRTNIGTVVSDDGLLAVDLPPGEHDVTLRFLPRSAVGGALASLAAAIACWWLWRRARAAMLSRRGRIAAAAAVLGPFAVALLVRAVMAQPAAPPKIARGPTGDAIVADELPADVRPLNVEYANHVKLVAVTLSPSTVRAGGLVKMELYWETTGEVPPGVGVFVHVQPPVGAFLNRDHALISSTMDFSEAPRGKLLRDVVVVAVPATARPETWTLWVGLWMSRGDGSRVPIVSAGSADIVDGRVKAASFEVR